MGEVTRASAGCARPYCEVLGRSRNELEIVLKGQGLEGTKSSNMGLSDQGPNVGYKRKSLFPRKPTVKWFKTIGDRNLKGRNKPLNTENFHRTIST